MAIERDRRGSRHLPRVSRRINAAVDAQQMTVNAQQFLALSFHAHILNGVVIYPTAVYSSCDIGLA